MAFWRHYTCKTCNHVFDGLHYKYDEDAYACKECGAETHCDGEWTGASVVVFNHDKLLHDGVKSPVDGKMYTSRKTWGDHLKAHNCREVGNDWNNKLPQRELRGDFNVRPELERVAHQILNK